MQTVIFRAVFRNATSGWTFVERTTSSLILSIDRSMHLFLHLLLALSSCLRSKKNTRTARARFSAFRYPQWFSSGPLTASPRPIQAALLRSCNLPKPVVLFFLSVRLGRVCTKVLRVKATTFFGFNFSNILHKIPNCTKFRMDKIRNWWTKPRNGQNPNK